MKTKKLLSLLLALMMMLSVVPMYASAAEPIALTEDNITVWPTITGTCHVGEPLEDALTIIGGEVKYNDEVVIGKFEFNEPTKKANMPSSSYAPILKFVPEDETAYSSFITTSTNENAVKIAIAKTTPVLQDENNPPVASEIITGQTLADSTITGGTMINPYTKETFIAASKWKWVDTTIVVTESGYYDAKFKVMGTYLRAYEEVTQKIYVSVQSKIATITELPTIESFEYTPSITWSDVKLNGGAADIAGTFSVADSFKDTTPYAGSYNIDVVFTPEDTSYTATTHSIPVEVVKTSIKFIDSNGTSTIPEITVPYGLKMSDDIGNYLKSYLNTSASFNFTETQYYNEYIPVGTHDLTVKASCSNANYESEAVLPFKLTVEPIETAVTVKYDINKDNKNTYEIYVVKADVDGARPQGSFAIYVDGKLLKDGAKYSEHITWSPEKSKAYTVKVVYTPTANDPCLVADTEITVDAKLYRNITTVNTSSDGEKQFRCGETIQVAANVPEFSGWVITDAAGNTVDLGVDLSANSIEFAVPDFDVKLEAKGKTSSGTTGGGIFDMDFGSLTEGDSEWAMINIIRNIIAMFKSFLQQLIETFQSIGD